MNSVPDGFRGGRDGEASGSALQAAVFKGSAAVSGQEARGTCTGAVGTRSVTARGWSGSQQVGRTEGEGARGTNVWEQRR